MRSVLNVEAACLNGTACTKGPDERGRVDELRSVSVSFRLQTAFITIEANAVTSTPGHSNLAWPNDGTADPDRSIEAGARHRPSDDLAATDVGRYPRAVTVTPTSEAEDGARGQIVHERERETRRSNRQP